MIVSSGMKGREGLFPSTVCVKIKGHFGMLVYKKYILYENMRNKYLHNVLLKKTNCVLYN